jgi:hypothetical protein
LAGTHGVGTFQKQKSSSAFGGNISLLGGNFSEMFPPKAEELFYFVRVPPLKLQHTQPCLKEKHKKNPKEKFLRKLLQTEFIHHHAKLHMVLTRFRPYDSQDKIIYTNVRGEPDLPQFICDFSCQ